MCHALNQLPPDAAQFPAGPRLFRPDVLCGALHSHERIASGDRVSATDLDKLLESVSPALAAKILANNPSNRPVRNSHVEYLAGAMRRGEWIPNHQAIAISPHGVLLDGQHRLHGVVRSGVAVMMVIMRNVPEETFASTDQNIPRTKADVLGYPRKDLEISSFFYYLMSKTSHGTVAPTPTQISGIHEVFAPIIDDLDLSVGTQRRVFGAAPMRSVVVLRAATGHRDYARRIYVGLNSHKPGDLPPLAQSFYQQVMTNNVALEKKLIAARAWHATDPQRGHVARLQVSDPAIQLAEMRAALTRIAPGVFE